jgi:hypothetical protein
MLAVVATSAQADARPIQIAPFTDAVFAAPTARLVASAEAASAAGTFGQGVKPNTALTLKGLDLNPVEGLIAVWVKPSWNGNDGKKHRLWATEQTGGRQLTLEKSELGMLRAKIATPTGVTVSRTDVSDWKAGEWHQVSVGWVSNKTENVGLALWIDQWCKDGPVTPHGVWDAKAMPASITLGDGSGDAVFDELIVRDNMKGETDHGMVACIYRDYFRTAPFESYKVDIAPSQVPSDARAVAGGEKQFGLLGKRGGSWEPLVENVVRYSQWAYFDSKPLIKWSTSDSSIATIDDKGRLKALKPGQCDVVTDFRGVKSTYPLTVISPDKPDLAAICIELLPRFRSDAVKCRFAPGETVTSVIRLGNFGPKRLEAGAKVRLSFIPDSIRNYRLDPTEKAVEVKETTLDKALEPGEETTVEFKWPYPAKSTWMKLELDPENKIDEICEVNNSIVELTDARPIHLAYRPADLKKELADKKTNHVGSFCYYDWLRAEKLRMDVMLREAIYPTTGPNGVEEAYRIDDITALNLGKWDDEPYNQNGIWFDGGFPVNEPVDLMAIDCAIIHEFGHCILSQPDLYGYPISAHNVFLLDDLGKPVAGSPDMPIIAWNNVSSPPALNVPCNVGYGSLMDGCEQWLHPSQAGHIMHYKGFRPDRFWGTQGRLIPTRANWLLLKDADDKPLKNAAVYVYHVSQSPVQDSGAKYFADRPKFMGQTDDEGRFVFPGETDEDWDDPATDVVDGAKPVWNPFGTPDSETAFTPNVWEVEGLLLLKIVSGKQVEYQFMDLTQFNVAFLSGETVCGKYDIRTSLTSAGTPTALVRKPIPDAIKKVNLAPVAVCKEEMTVKCGEEFELDGSKSYDPENQPLIYRWNVGEGWLQGPLSQGSKMKQKAPAEPKELEFKLWVNDGIRCSEAVTIKVHVVK